MEVRTNKGERLAVTFEMQETMLFWLLAQRCENYGYDWKMFRNISQQRYRARKAMQTYLACAYSLDWERAPLAYRLNWDTMDYTCGQSQNEEITNLLRQLVNPNAQWVS